MKRKNIRIYKPNGNSEGEINWILCYMRLICDHKNKKKREYVKRDMFVVMCLMSHIHAAKLSTKSTRILNPFENTLLWSAIHHNHNF